MRRSKPELMGDIWEEFLKNAPTIARKIAEAKAADYWSAVAGNRIAMYTSDVTVVRGILYATITSASARSEAFTRRLQMRDRMNELLGADVIKNVILK